MHMKYLCETSAVNEGNNSSLRSHDVTLINSTVTSSSNSPSTVLSRIGAIDRVVRGLTVLFDQVFVVCQHAAAVEVYDTATLTLQRHLAVDGLCRPIDMTSSLKYGCLYIADLGYTGGKRPVVHRVNLTRATTDWPLSDRPAGLSVTPDGYNVIVVFRGLSKLKEYTTHGDLVREILLREDVINPRHAVQLTSGQFVVSQGRRSDSVHRVCLAEFNGRVAKCFDGQPGSGAGQITRPIHIATDHDGSVLVADIKGDRVLLLTASLDYVGELVPRRDVSKRCRPVRLCLDQRFRVLYVAENERNGQTEVAGQLVAYKVKTV